MLVLKKRLRRDRCVADNVVNQNLPKLNVMAGVHLVIDELDARQVVVVMLVLPLDHKRVDGFLTSTMARAAMGSVGLVDNRRQIRVFEPQPPGILLHLDAASFFRIVLVARAWLINPRMAPCPLLMVPDRESALTILLKAGHHKLVVATQEAVLRVKSPPLVDTAWIWKRGPLRMLPIKAVALKPCLGAFGFIAFATLLLVVAGCG